MGKVKVRRVARMGHGKPVEPARRSIVRAVKVRRRRVTNAAVGAEGLALVSMICSTVDARAGGWARVALGAFGMQRR